MSMTIEQAWLIVLDYYHDLLPADLQWRPGQKCSVNKVECRHFDQPWFKSARDEDWGKNWAEHDIPAPALTDAAAMAVLRAIVSRDGGPDPRDAIIFEAAELAKAERAK